MRNTKPVDVCLSWCSIVNLIVSVQNGVLSFLLGSFRYFHQYYLHTPAANRAENRSFESPDTCPKADTTVDECQLINIGEHKSGTRSDFKVGAFLR